MNKINYPENTKDRQKFEDDFYDSIIKTNLTTINNHLKNISFKGKPLDFKTLITLKFEELIGLENKIKTYSKSHRTFKSLFKYKSNQPKLAKFFMTQKVLVLKSCHYCSIDFINSFSDFPDYETPLDFINNSDINDLLFINGINEKIAKAIIKKRNGRDYKGVSELPASESIKKEIRKLPLNNSHNHFTLDHILPQSEFKFYSLCLYNLVPSCYSCNSKFKKKIEFDLDNNLQKISPTCDNYSLYNDFKFQLFYTKKYDDLKLESDFSVRQKIYRNNKHIQTYLRMFKIPGRYVHHKDQVIKLIEKKKMYPETKITELSGLLKKSKKEIRKMLFGEELYNKDMSNLQLVKFKRDIAHVIKIKDVIA